VTERNLSLGGKEKEEKEKLKRRKVVSGYYCVKMEPNGVIRRVNNGEGPRSSNTVYIFPGRPSE
jgi:transcription antitermination factor NusG